MSAILFGSISTLADTSELQRQAFNQAFEAHGIEWRWSQEEYLSLLEQSGGQQRITDYARSVGQEVDAEAVHRSKSELFQRGLAETNPPPRDGVVETIQEGRQNGYKIALVTTTSKENVSSLIEALSPDVQSDDFDLIVDSSNVGQGKPAPAAYQFALEALDEEPDDCVAIEDNVEGVDSATAAGLGCTAFPNENTAGHNFDEAAHRVDRLNFSELQTFIPSAQA